MVKGHRSVPECLMNQSLPKSCRLHRNAEPDFRFKVQQRSSHSFAGRQLLEGEKPWDTPLVVEHNATPGERHDPDDCGWVIRREDLSETKRHGLQHYGFEANQHVFLG